MKRVSIVALLVPLFAVSAPAFAQNAIQSEIPDFYQHQGLGSATPLVGWEGVGTAATWNGTDNIANWGGICAFTSITDALYPWYATGNYAKLFGNGVTVAGLTGAGTWLDQSNVAQQFVTDKISGKTLSTYFKDRGVAPSGANVLNGASGLTGTTYTVDGTGNLHMILADGNESASLGNAFAYYQKLSDWGQASGAEQGVSTVLYIGPTATAFDGPQAYPYWWTNFHAVAGAGYAGGQIRYADPDAIPVNAGNGAGAPPKVGDAGFLASVASNQYGNAANGPGQAAGGAPVPGNNFTNAASANVNYTTANLYGTMTLNGSAIVTASSGPYAKLVGGKRTTQLDSIDAISQAAASLVSEVPVGGASTDTKATFRITGDFGGNISELMIFPTEDIDLANMGFSFNAPGWATSLTMVDPFGDAMPDGGLLLTEDTGANLTSTSDFLATLNTSLTFDAYTVFAFDPATNTWLGQTVNAVDDTVFTSQNRFGAPDAPSGALAVIGFALMGMMGLVRVRSPRTRRANG